MRIAFWAGIGCAVVWLIFVGTPAENTLRLAAAGKIDAGVAWFYRFRDASIPTDGGFGNLAFRLLLLILNATGTRLWGAFAILLSAILLKRANAVVAILGWILAIAGAVWGEGVWVWLLFYAFVAKLAALLRSFRNSTMAWLQVALLSLGIFWSLGLVFAMADPRRLYTRHAVLRGQSYRSLLIPRLYTKIRVAEACQLAVVNPDDLDGVEAIELIDYSSLLRFGRIVLLDLKIIESQYRLLELRDQNHEFVFSAAARQFAMAEKQYADRVRQEILQAEEVCLIAPFAFAPETEPPPYSRAREIWQTRKSAKRPTTIIHLPPLQ